MQDIYASLSLSPCEDAEPQDVVAQETEVDSILRQALDPNPRAKKEYRDMVVVSNLKSLSSIIWMVFCPHFPKSSFWVDYFSHSPPYSQDALLPLLYEGFCCHRFQTLHLIQLREPFDLILESILVKILPSLISHPFQIICQQILRAPT